ncbi:hypothetical protein HJ024_00535 [Vibrio parahaemolyticus]|uniref:hypothetical protein n=1 Tax=Vibrio parahaemolyticus TaxID=670 RepID=UPI00186AA210|nr:hypothetical protein [Vibrio parahaemolyticus]MBE4408858.1 hypothetical protein [Vibrio parahaemolyticus]MCC3789383.1 hypothetical protein [Vibrio parahaemolyticus]HBH7874743.1 hypothetical protein [Vibrio parahaemolyticus]
MNVRLNVKVAIFDWITKGLENGTLEILLKSDETGEHDFVSIADIGALLDEFKGSAKHEN